MSQDREEPLGIEELIDRQLEGINSPAEEALLLERLTNDPAARETWIAMAGLETILENNGLADELSQREVEVRELAFLERSTRPKQDLSILPRSFAIGSVISVAIAGCLLVALLFYDFHGPRQTAGEIQSENQLREIGMALGRFEGENGGFPTAYSADSEGNPLLSWRVHLLPFLQQSDLYGRFHLDEPWNSLHNRKLIDAMPAVYRSPLSATGTTTTYVAVPVADAILRPPSPGEFAWQQVIGVRPEEVTDGLANTVAVVEVFPELAVPWTKPVDFPVGSNPLEQRGGPFAEARLTLRDQDRVNCRFLLMADQTVRQADMGGSIDLHWVTKAGDEPVAKGIEELPSIDGAPRRIRAFPIAVQNNVLRVFE